MERNSRPIEIQQTALSSKACGTIINYTSSLNHWVKFTSDHKLVVFPGFIVDVALYFSHLTTSKVSASVIDTSYCSLKWAHDFQASPKTQSRSLKGLVGCF